MKRLLILIIVAFTLAISCQKEVRNTETIQMETADRLYSVANVYYTEDGKKIQVWFYETPLVHEINVTNVNSKTSFELLTFAKDNEIPINVRLVPEMEDQIQLVIPATAEQTAALKKELAGMERATEIQMHPDNDSTSISKESATGLISVVPSLSALNTIFNKVRKQACDLGPFEYGQCVPFQFVADGCYARAHKTRQIVEDYYGYTSYKYFNFACKKENLLRVKSSLWKNNGCCVQWWFHVATVVDVKNGNTARYYVIDPAMFNEAVTLSTWISAQKNTSCGYKSADLKQMLFDSKAYTLRLGDLDTKTCTITPRNDKGYSAANRTCRDYASMRGCTFN